ncbi:MAG: LacI family DNA-binding transcriptional regulator [Ktedonobacteraceae bacterium]|nr:LacI family DNA-binding transcriptional regulator [Ktedonobacteraceae bacterium]
MKQAVSKRGTITSIASIAGVSIPTVSRVLHNHPDVAPETRKRVELVIEESGFIRNRVKQGLRRKSSGIVDMLIPDLNNPYSIEIVRGVEEVLSRTNLRLALSVTQDTLQLEQRWLTKILNSEATDGAILVLLHGQQQCFDTLSKHKIPFVAIDQRGDLGLDVPSVGTTNWFGGRLATEHLISLGHRRIAIITGPPSIRCSQDRLAGYRATLDDACIPVDPALIRSGAFVQETGYDQACALLELPEPPTAIFTGNDMQAMGVYSAFRARGLRIPHDMSVIGFDDVPIASILSPSLTTVRQPLMEMGRVGTTMLLRLIAGEPLDSTRVELTTTLCVRASCMRYHSGTQIC